jgi:HNH endonuclease
MYPVLFPIKRTDFVKATPTAFAIADRFWKKVEKSDGCWLWIGTLHSKGYGWMKFTLSRSTAGKKRKFVVRAHRLSWLLHFGEIPAGLGVLHACDKRRCVNPAHLFLGTDKDNWEDAKAKGRRARVNGRFAKGPNCL